MARKATATATETSTVEQFKPVGGDVPAGHVRVRVTQTEFDLPIDTIVERLLPATGGQIKAIDDRMALPAPSTDIEITSPVTTAPPAKAV